MSTATLPEGTEPDVDYALAAPEPPASPLWHRHGGVPALPLTDAQRKRNCEFLVLAQRAPDPAEIRPGREQMPRRLRRVPWW
ncbi:hypothetical protein OS965_38610 [Streptomyces sp. H27-G5]|uniref:hypothetical protein n=1 Tax=Streptomyces sp. H27-G5 TaxID=2996698 RepID=UPI00226EF49C|nr:hypothetical protein [Streptomyces sp. H27-G5]MCY0923976.1 hypothetical protein [Streptomyces sp. H27-G5]